MIRNQMSLQVVGGEIVTKLPIGPAQASYFRSNVSLNTRRFSSLHHIFRDLKIGLGGTAVAAEGNERFNYRTGWYAVPKKMDWILASSAARASDLIGNVGYESGMRCKMTIVSASGPSPRSGYAAA
jgi:hypothetical protein